MPRLFDTYIMVDWSAASSPKTGKDSIWIGELDGATGQMGFKNPSTRKLAYRMLEQRLSELTETSQRVLLGFDFSLGFPAGTTRALGLEGPSWRAMHTFLHREVEDSDNNSNNRFAVAARMNAKLSGRAFPFWGVTSKRHENRTLSATKPSFECAALSEYRMAEKIMRTRRLGAPKSCWQLAYIGSVGSQSLMGIPYVQKLRQRFATAQIWPFETGFSELGKNQIERAQIVIAEIYPSLVKTKPSTDEPADKSQIRAIARHYWEMDKCGSLGAAFAPPEGLNAEILSNIDAEEGWILGITPIIIGNLAG